MDSLTKQIRHVYGQNCTGNYKEGITKEYGQFLVGEINKKIKLIKRDAKKFHKVKNKKSKVVIDESILSDNIQDKFEI